MDHTLNHLGQPVGPPLAGWRPPAAPERTALEGRYCRLEPLDAGRHAEALFQAYTADKEGRLWTYLPYGPFDRLEDFTAWIRQSCLADDPLFFAIIDLATGRSAGVASYLRIDPAAGSIEVGHINYSPALQRTAAATEAMYLMMERAFGLGFRRYEWKCDCLNEASRSAAQRLGLSFEGIFRQATVYKGRSRDTAWYSVIDLEWPALREAFERWLDPSNFDSSGRQRVSLSKLTGVLLERRG
ncbi:MAG: GNAT family protein [Candidatus Glassbacteria bacterium]